MAKPSSGEAVPRTVAEAANSSWYSFKHYHPASAEDPHTAHIVGYRRGYTSCIEQSAYWSGLVEQVQRLNELLEELVITQEAVRSAAEEEVQA
jgi:hypothetical protein